METFRELLEHLEKEGTLKTVSRPVDPRHELTAVMRTMQKGENHALLFSNVAGSDVPVATNVFGFRHAVAAALGVEEKNLLKMMVAQENRRLPVEKVDTAPVQEVIKLGSEVDVARDIPLHHRRRADRSASGFRRL
jgi:2,5-furandicarboxylate decarboxylase 1